MTEEERTKLQRLAERLRAAAEHGDDGLRSISSGRFGLPDRFKYDLDAAAAAILNLLSLAAQSEELRAELEKETKRAENLEADWGALLNKKERWREAHHAIAAAMEEQGEQLDAVKKALALAGKAFRRILKNPADAEAVRAEADGWQHPPTDDPTLMVQLEAAEESRRILESRYTALVTAARVHVESWARSPEEGIPTPEETIDALGALLEASGVQE